MFNDISKYKGIREKVKSMELQRLMIVDDEKIILRGLIETYDWEDMGFKVIASAQNGEEALQKVIDYRPDVVLTDICMKKMDGLKLMEETAPYSHAFCA